MYEYIFTIGCFDKLHKGHIKFLKNIKSLCNKLIIGIHNDDSVKQLKNTNDVDLLNNRINNIKKYATDIFIITKTDPTDEFKNYINTNFPNTISCINIGSSNNQIKILNNVEYNGNLYFTHEYHDRFLYLFNSNKLIIKRVDNNSGWGQNLIGYCNNWCYMRADDNIYFPSIDYVHSIMPIKYLPYSNDISSTNLRNYKNNKVGLMNFMLKKIVKILDKYKIDYYLDCGTLIGCVREGGLMEKDTDIDITIHLSDWDKLNNIDFPQYNLIRTRTLEGFPNIESSNMISVKTPFSNFYCDIYANPAFPKLEKYIINGIKYNIPIKSDVYLTQLYGNWKIPSNKHADTKFHRGNGLLNSSYNQYWDNNYTFYKPNF